MVRKITDIPIEKSPVSNNEMCNKKFYCVACGKECNTKAVICSYDVNTGRPLYKLYATCPDYTMFSSHNHNRYVSQFYGSE